MRREWKQKVRNEDTIGIKRVIIREEENMVEKINMAW